MEYGRCVHIIHLFWGVQGSEELSEGTATKMKDASHLSQKAKPQTSQLTSRGQSALSDTCLQWIWKHLEKQPMQAIRAAKSSWRSWLGALLPQRGIWSRLEGYRVLAEHPFSQQMTLHPEVSSAATQSSRSQLRSAF